MQSFDKVINRKNTFCTQWDYTFDRFGDDEILPFSISDMDFMMPDGTVDFISNYTRENILGYSRWNHDEFKQSVIDWYDYKFGYKLNGDYISYSPTVIYSVAIMLQLNSSINDNVMLFTPGYDGLINVIKENQRQIIRSKLIISNDEFIIDKEDFISKIKDTNVLVFCSPHNPIAKVWSNEELEFIVKECKKNNVFIISDDIHMDLVYKPLEFIPIFKIGEKYEYLNNMMIATSATKSFNFPSLGFSYMLVPSEKLREKFANKLKLENGLSSPNILGLLATMDVYNNQRSWNEKLLSYLDGNIKFLEEELLNTNLKVCNTEGTYLVWIDAKYYEKDFERLINILYNDVKLGIMSGDVYEGKYFLRLNVGCPRKKLEDGVNKLKEAIKKWEKS